MLYDAVVIGGGPAGATAALLLARAGWSVALVERSAFPRRKVCGEYLSATNMALLDHLGIGAKFRELAGPPVRKVAVFSGKTMVHADLPRPERGEWGRALSRERFDTLLLDEARRAGAEVRQPWKVLSVAKEESEFCCAVAFMDDDTKVELTSRIVIAAHGSWGPSPWGRQECPPHGATDLLGFKAHFEQSALDPELMPLLAFPGGYGGMVRCDGERVSLSCCVRRNQLAALRGASPGDAGDAVLSHIEASCLGARQALAGSRRVGAWLAAGPLRPGIRRPEQDGILLAGNAAGEAHPVIAEGISMALQSAWILCGHLIAWKRQGGNSVGLTKMTHAYGADWRRHFGRRLRLSQLVAHWAMRPTVVGCTLPFLRSIPSALTWFARQSGKAHNVVC